MGFMVSAPKMWRACRPALLLRLEKAHTSEQALVLLLPRDLDFFPVDAYAFLRARDVQSCFAP